MAYAGCNRLATQLLLAIPGAFGGAVYAGNAMNHIALSPKYAGTMYGITNAAANMCGFLAPYVIGLIIEGRVRILYTVSFFISRSRLSREYVFLLVFLESYRVAYIF